MIWPRMSRNEVDDKRFLLVSTIAVSVGFFVYKRHVLGYHSRYVSMRHRLRFDELVRRNFVYSYPKSTISSRLGYAFNHASWSHLGTNMMLMYIFGRDLVEDERVSLGQFGSIVFCSTIAATLAHRKSVPMIGSSGIVMGLLGGIALLDPTKTWILILPVPGVPVTNMQLAQGILASHLIAIGMKLRVASKYALAGHIGGLFAGIVVTWFYKNQSLGSYNSREFFNQWSKTFSCAGLVLYWFLLSARVPFTGDADRGELLAKRRFLERSLNDQY